MAARRYTLHYSVIVDPQPDGGWRAEARFEQIHGLFSLRGRVLAEAEFRRDSEHDALAAAEAWAAQERVRIYTTGG